MRIGSSAELKPAEAGPVTDPRYKDVLQKQERPTLTKYFGAPMEMAPGPQAFLAQSKTPRYTIDAHFHDVNQFQLFVEGFGRLGKRPASPITFHYADAYTPYGPIVAGEEGISFFTLRPRASGGYFGMPGSRDKMPGKAGRNIARSFAPIEPEGSEQKEPVLRETLIEPEPDGLLALRLRLRAGVEATGIDPAGGGGQYYLVAAGSLVRDGQELPRFSLLFVEPGEIAPVLHPGPHGADLLVLQFPAGSGVA